MLDHVGANDVLEIPVHRTQPAVQVGAREFHGGRVGVPGQSMQATENPRCTRASDRYPAAQPISRTRRPSPLSGNSASSSVWLLLGPALS